MIKIFVENMDAKKENIKGGKWLDLPVSNLNSKLEEIKTASVEAREGHLNKKGLSDDFIITQYEKTNFHGINISALIEIKEYDDISKVQKMAAALSNLDKKKIEILEYILVMRKETLLSIKNYEEIIDSIKDYSQLDMNINDFIKKLISEKAVAEKDFIDFINASNEIKAFLVIKVQEKKLNYDDLKPLIDLNRFKKELFKATNSEEFKNKIYTKTTKR